MSVLDAGSTNLIVAYPDELVHDAMHSMVAHDIGRLPVVSRDDPFKMRLFQSRLSARSVVVTKARRNRS
jgi:CIC family chloride channel protein